MTATTTTKVLEVLSRNLTGEATQHEVVDFLADHLPRFDQPVSRSEWTRRAQSVRRRMLRSFFQGHPDGILQEEPRVVWSTIINTGGGYRIRKLRYEGYPGLWVPALLYEPVGLRNRKVPAVLNPNGHHAGGKAMEYKQARCINLAKRGMLALNTEFIGMGELHADCVHSRIGHLDLCGISGVGVFYLIMKRGLDVLLAHRNADPDRVAMTGLSGGGWQTAVLSALDTRIKVIVPVAGHSPAWQRIDRPKDIGDLEQLPSDQCSIADYDELTALFAPRPSLLIYNRNDDCCFQAARSRLSIYQPVVPVFELLNAGHNLEFHENVDPGTHNYEKDNRTQMYRFLNRHFGLDGPDEEIPYDGEVLSEEELKVGLPLENATLNSLALKAWRAIGEQRPSRPARRKDAARKRLARILRLPDLNRIEIVDTNSSTRGLAGRTVRSLILRVGPWSVPVTEIVPKRPRGVALALFDKGRSGTTNFQVDHLLAGDRRIYIADIYGTGEAAPDWPYHMVMASTGHRPLGLQVGQVMALVRWICRMTRRRQIDLLTKGPITSTVALVTTALRPVMISKLATSSLFATLGSLIAADYRYEDLTPLFCFGLLSEFDTPELIDLCRSVPFSDETRGLL
jgi:hypothetical protein